MRFLSPNFPCKDSLFCEKHACATLRIYFTVCHKCIECGKKKEFFLIGGGGVVEVGLLLFYYTGLLERIGE